MSTVGQVLFSLFEDHLRVQKGLRPGSIKSYRDTMKLFLAFTAQACHRPVTRLTMADLSSQRVLEFLQMIEAQRHNKPQTRNQRLAGLHTFYRYLAVHHPEMLAEAQRVEAIPNKRTQPPATRYLERDEIDRLFESLPATGALALRDQALLMLLYNTGARVQEVYLLESGVEPNVIRAWLGHVSLDTTNRYAEITMRTKQAALDACLPPISSAVRPVAAGWRKDQDLMKWLQTL